ncbi:MAG: RHS repeat-associated core domain-containing protein [Anaerolineales bacterium]
MASDLSQVLDDGTNTYLYGNPSTGAGQAGPITQTNGADTEYFLGDALGSVRQMTDLNGAITLDQNYDPFGNPDGSLGSATSIFGYDGEQVDPSGMIYLRARDYDPRIMEFQQPDTIVPNPNIPDEWNKYNYAQDDPIIQTDPSGHCIGPEGVNLPDGSPACNTGGGTLNTNPTKLCEIDPGLPQCPPLYGPSPVYHFGLTEKQLVNQFQQDQGNTEYCALYAISTALNMLYGTHTTGMDVVSAYWNIYGLIDPGGSHCPSWGWLYWGLNGDAVLPYQQVSIVNLFSSKILRQKNDLPIAEEKMLSPEDLIQAISNPKEAVLFTFNTIRGNWLSGHTIVLAAYDPKQGFGFLNSGWGRNPHGPQSPSLTWFSIAQFQEYEKDPIGLWDNNFVVITRP